MNLHNDSELTISRLAPLLRRRKLSPVELTRWILERINRLQPRINAYITVTSDLALKHARQAEREIAKNGYRGPLHGIPISLKDLFHTRGVRTTGGSTILRRFMPAEDAPVVGRMFDAGAVLIGKTNLHEFAYGATNVNLHYGAVRNPWDLERMSGGSSGGSAASVSAGLSLASLGTDTGGSIRIPAAACGCVGLKPTHGFSPLSGVIPLAPSLDHVGPLCRCVADVGLILNAIAGLNEDGGSGPAGLAVPFNREIREGVKGLHIGIPRQYFFDRIDVRLKSLVLTAIEVFEELGAEVHEVNLEQMQETALLAGVITVAEALTYHRKWLEKRAGDYDPAIRARMEASRNLTAVEYLLAQEKRRSYGAAFERSMRTVDLLAVPSLPVFAPRIDDKLVTSGRSREDVRMALLRLTRPANLTGLPAISIPCGFSKAGLPAGLQLIGQRWGEATLLRAAWAYEQATPWHRQFPQLLDL